MAPSAVPARYNFLLTRAIISILSHISYRVGVQTVTLLKATSSDSLSLHLSLQKNLRPVIFVKNQVNHFDAEGIKYE
jgi:hypothetical protein